MVIRVCRDGFATQGLAMPGIATRKASSLRCDGRERVLPYEHRWSICASAEYRGMLR